MPGGRRVSVAGLVLVRQRPGKGNAIFLTLEDEGAVANIIVWARNFERFRAVVMGARFIRVTGKLQSESGVIHIVAEKAEDLTPWLSALLEERTPSAAVPAGVHGESRASPRRTGGIVCPSRSGKCRNAGGQGRQSHAEGEEFPVMHQGRRPGRQRGFLGALAAGASISTGRASEGSMTGMPSRTG